MLEKVYEGNESLRSTQSLGFFKKKTDNEQSKALISA